MTDTDAEFFEELYDNLVLAIKPLIASIIVHDESGDDYPASSECRICGVLTWGGGLQHAEDCFMPAIMTLIVDHPNIELDDVDIDISQLSISRQFDKIPKLEARVKQLKQEYYDLWVRHNGLDGDDND